MAKSCRETAESLVECLKNSPCVKAGKTIRECLKEMENDQSHPCTEYRYAYAHCKRGSLDMRSRIRGDRVF